MATTTPQINHLIAWVRKNNGAARAARFLLQCFDVVCQTTTWHVYRQRKPVAVNHSFFALAWKWKVHFIYFVRRDQDAIIAKQYLFLVFTHVMRRPCWCTKQWQNVAQVLHNNRIKFPEDSFRYCSVHQHGRRDVTWKPRIYKFFLKWPFRCSSRRSFLNSLLTPRWLLLYFRWSGDVIRRTGMKNFNAVSHNRARPYFWIQHGRDEVRACRVYLNVHSVTGNVVDMAWSVEVWR